MTELQFKNGGMRRVSEAQSKAEYLDITKDAGSARHKNGK